MDIHNHIRQEIEEVAYELWEKGGCLTGREIENWLEAERIVMTKYAEKVRAKEKPKEATPYEKMPVELKKASPKEMKKEAPEKKGPVRKAAKKADVKKERGKTK